ncbi:MAG: alpha-glucan family phosphorylase, partial [Bacillota bacterium]
TIVGDILLSKEETMTNYQQKIAYLCMEFGLNEQLPLYAGGLGILAGDFLKAARKKGAPVVGIGIRWWQNYTTQYINEHGYPYDTFPTHYPDSLENTGRTVTVQIAGESVLCRIHRVTAFDNAPLYLLDTGDPESKYGWITDRLYEGNKQDRIAQEIVLGIGGVKALAALGISVDKFHFNEGHAAFAGLQLIKNKMDSENSSFEQALRQTRKQVVFTTHTPVPAGNETHQLHEITDLGANCGLNHQQLEFIGGNPFNMTAACLHMSGIANGVSRLHGQTARDMWKTLERSASIISITNGVHLETWQDPLIKETLDNNGDLWQAHLVLKKRLVDYIQRHTGASMRPENLIIGFARRAAPYKRNELIFRDTEQISEFLASEKLQLVFSGKAHPDDHYGKEIVATLVKMDKKYRDSIVFLENYDMEIARYLARGCDVWLNNPKRPLEASGTSGMKAAINGTLNLSVLDGWVAEGVEHGHSGWIFDHVFPELNNSLGEDEKDLRALYRIIKQEVIPTYYDNREQWVEMMKASIEMAIPDFTASRMLDDYYQKLYRTRTESLLT